MIRFPRRLRGRLLASHLLVVAVGGATLWLTVDQVAPNAFDSAMGHSMGDQAAGMNGMMGELVRSAFRDAVTTSLTAALAVAVTISVIASLALAWRIGTPISRLAAASRRIAQGRYAERVPGRPAGDEIGDLADDFNRMAESLEATERRRLELVGDVAHELRTPLTTLEGFVEGLEDGVISPGERTWGLIHGEVGRLSRLVNDLQELWRAEARQVPLSIQPVDPGAAIVAVSERLRQQANDRRVELRLDVPARLPPIAADPERLAEVLDNIVSNAIRYSPSGGQITVSAHADSGEVTIAVADQGPGLTEDQRQRVFERFYRVDPSRSRALGGSGIGLAIGRALTLAMGGRIWAESAGPDSGSTFRVALPLA